MIARFKTVSLDQTVTVTAPDGSRVDILAACSRGSMARFSLAPGLVSKAVRHKTVEELWYFIAGRGEMWLNDGQDEAVVELRAGVSLSIPAATSFQFRSRGAEPLEAIGVTMPPWPGVEEAEFVEGTW